MTTRLDPHAITPLHEIRDLNKLYVLRQSMEIDGWQGRPILVMPSDEDPDYLYQALTGTHRIEAAIQAGLEGIPIMIINPYADMWDCGYEEIDEILLDGNDEDRLSWLRKHGFNEAAQLMLMEVP